MNCKHVVAVLLEVMARKSARTVAASGVNPSGHSAGVRSSKPFASVRRQGSLLLDEKQPEPEPVLAPDLVAWIDSLAQLRASESEDYPPEVRQRLIYVLDLDKRMAGMPHLVVQPTSVRLLKDGSFADQSTSFNPSNVHSHQLAKFVRPSDRDILKRLHQMPRAVGMYPATSLPGEEGVVALSAMIATGRAQWGTVGGPVLTQGPVRRGAIVWRLSDDGSHYPDLDLAGGGTARAVVLAPPWYVDAAAGVVGPVDTGYAPRTAAKILSAPPVPARQTRLLGAAIAQRVPELSAIGLPHVSPPEQIAGPPVCGLRLMACELPPQNYGFSWQRPAAGTQPERVLLARAFFRYGTMEVRADETRPRPTFAREGRIVEIQRDRKIERAALTRLAEVGFEKLSTIRPYGLPVEHRNDLGFAEEDGADWIDLLYHEVPALRAEGWEIEIEADFPVRLVRAEGDFSAEFRESSGIDWFELDLGVVVDGERLDLVPVILSAIASPGFDARAMTEQAAEGEPIYLPLADGRVLAMPAARLQPILAMLLEIMSIGVIDRKGEGIGFSIRDAAAVADLEAATAAAGVVWQGGERLRELGRLLRETGGIPRAELPSTFVADLRPYQSRGVDWLQFLRAAGLGGVLADDMGLGKTVQALAHFAIEKASGRLDRPALVVAPTSLMANWRREAERFVPQLKVLILHGSDRKTRFAEIAAHDLVLTTYPLLARDHATLGAQPWHLVVLDEAQTIKNPDAATTRLVGQFDARHRLCLTGTPLENHLGELWSLFSFLSPGFLGDRKTFNRLWRLPIEKRGDHERQRLLAKRVHPFMLRRTKADVAADLPPKTEIVEAVEMEAVQRDLYESIRLAMHGKVRDAIAAKGLARSHIIVLDALLKLRQVCCDPRLVKLKVAETAKARSAKLDRLMEMLPDLIEEGRRILLFSQFTSMLALIEQALRDSDIRYVLLTGDTRDRDTPIRRFQAGEVPLFLISLKAGGVGLNLTAADTVIHYDPWWNPAVEDQATDRAHRIGQDKPVFVHKLTVVASIEEKMDALKSRKRALAAGLFDPDAASAADLTEADIETLFGPG